MSGLLGDFHFVRPAAFLLVPVAVAIGWWWRRSADPLRGWRDQIEPALLAALVVGRDTSGRGPAGARLAAWLVTIVAIAGPTWRLEPSPFAEDATPLLILLEADVSMELPDLAPSRLERARLKIADLAEAREGQPLGLIAYAGSAHLVLPPTRDTAVVARMAAEIEPAIMPVAGDRLELALREAARVLQESEQGGNVLVVADGVASDPDVLREASAGLAAQFLAVGAPGATPDAGLRAAARALGVEIERLDLEGRDVAAIVRRAARAPVARAGAQGGRWQEAGYWLVPLVGLFVLASFRREERGEVAA